MDSETEALSEKFISKFNELEKKGNISAEKLFRATVDALELEGIRLLAASETVQEKLSEDSEQSKSEQPRRGQMKHVSLRELFTKDSSSPPSDKAE